MNKTVILERIGTLCRERGISMNTAFLESGVGKNFKSNMKTANPTMGKITMLSMYFNVSREFLLGESDNRGGYIKDFMDINGVHPVKRKSLPILGSIACGAPILLRRILTDMRPVTVTLMPISVFTPRGTV